MPELKCERLNKVLCRTCGNLDYWDGYYCSCENLSEKFKEKHLYDDYMPWINCNVEMTECSNYIKRKPCSAAPPDFECQFWCLGTHPGAPMEPCPYYKEFLASNKI